MRVLALVMTLSMCFMLDAKLEKIAGRQNSDNLWQLEVPSNWLRVPVEISSDTRLPIAEFQTLDYKVVVHNFPGMKIAPQAQVERWKRQKRASSVELQAFSGYQGLVYESDDTLAWALEWAASSKIKGELTADITFKITGNIKDHKSEIFEAIRSFETIENLCDE